MDFIFDPSLVLYLPLHELDGASFASRDALRHICVVSGTAWSSEGRTFDGVDDDIDIASGADSALDLITALTYEIWVRPLDGGDTYGRFMSKTNAATNLRKILLGKDADDETNVRWEIGDLSPTVLSSGTGKMVSGAWNHVVGTYKNTPDRRIYVNGVQVANDAPPGTIVSTAGGRLWLGAIFPGNQNFFGSIGEVRVYNRVLTAPEVQHNYVATKWRYQ